MAQVGDNAGASRVGRLILVRHGETEWSRTARHYRSHRHLSLTEHGERQARALTEQLHRWSFARVVVSPVNGLGAPPSWRN